MTRTMHKLFLAVCDLGEPRPVTADDCKLCPHGSVMADKSRVMCRGVTKFFMASCNYDMRSAAMIGDCERCDYGEIGEDRVRVYCSVFGPSPPSSKAPG